jgi:hypothetical protein
VQRGRVPARSGDSASQQGRPILHASSEAGDGPSPGCFTRPPFGEHRLAVEHSLAVRPALVAANSTTKGPSPFVATHPLTAVSHGAPLGERTRHGDSRATAMRCPFVGGSRTTSTGLEPAESLRLLHLWTTGPGVRAVLGRPSPLRGEGGEVVYGPWPTRQCSLEIGILIKMQILARCYDVSSIALTSRRLHDAPILWIGRG